MVSVEHKYMLRRINIRKKKRIKKALAVISNHQRWDLGDLTYQKEALFWKFKPMIIIYYAPVAKTYIMTDSQGYTHLG